MGRLEDLATFTRVIEARSLSGAARRLGSTKSAVSKQVNRLEAQLGTRLLHRTTNSSEALRVATLAGMGLAVLPTYAAGVDLRAGRLVPVLDEWQPVGRPAEADTLYAVYLPSRFPSPKVRALIDFLLEMLGDVPPWDRPDTNA
jgi:DNA-binding transcriptional LysR family regulator